MKRETRKNLFLLSLVTALAAGSWWVVIGERQAAYTPLTTMAADIDILAIDCPSQCRSRRFAREEGRWQMREPYAMPAEPEAVRRLLALAVAPSRSRRPASQYDLSKIGLRPALAIVTIGHEALSLGGTDAINGDRYVRIGGDVALVADRFSAWVLAPPESEIDRHPAAPLTVHSVLVEGNPHPELVPAWQTVTASQVQTPVQISASDKTILVELVASDADEQVRLRVLPREGRYVALREQPPLAYWLDEAQVQQLLPATR
ncbi:DUF4340 domain-containing protein [Tahibacter amnicola]|uniref:DUF4340 domain-containing protein n=1 Tax=Tahibacter amnicola TaxID=2976241 RepID=A0ABY6BEX1_9GAMM|nr:DUF4340 domain-containing protein [Tahibacter amnicola]UXI68586.1 DUF4340 domain-containing protein [Tahibacter amnicola]